MTALPGEGAATLILAASAGREPGGPTPGTSLLGLPLVRRAALAAERAGFQAVYVLGDESLVSPNLLEGTQARRFPGADPGHAIPAGRLVALSDRVLADPGLLKELRERPAEPERLYRIGGGALVQTKEPGPLAAALEGESRLEPIVAAWAAILPSGETDPGALPPFDVTGAPELAAAERRLLRGLVKEQDGLLARLISRRISLAVTRRLAATAMTPNAMTAVSVGLGLAGAAFLLSPATSFEIVGAVLFLLHSILDGCDGELARLKFQESRLGGVLDFWGDNVVHVAVFSAIAIAWTSERGERWPLILGALAVAGTLLSAGFVFARVMRPRAGDGPLLTSVSEGRTSRAARLSDYLARRDFIYLAPVLAVPGKVHWLLVPAAIGAPVFFFFLLAVGLGERRVLTAG